MTMDLIEKKRDVKRYLLQLGISITEKEQEYLTNAMTERVIILKERPKKKLEQTDLNNIVDALFHLKIDIELRAVIEEGYDVKEVEDFFSAWGIRKEIIPQLASLFTIELRRREFDKEEFLEENRKFMSAYDSLREQKQRDIKKEVPVETARQRLETEEIVATNKEVPMVVEGMIEAGLGKVYKEYAEQQGINAERLRTFHEMNDRVLNLHAEKLVLDEIGQQFIKRRDEQLKDKETRMRAVIDMLPYLTSIVERNTIKTTTEDKIQTASVILKRRGIEDLVEEIAERWVPILLNQGTNPSLTVPRPNFVS